ncbi:MAG: hypothetical protein NWF09_07790 [Candidatus Bathyarchaeota archaeon]|nr:hypothetical protein [Candidatus Bathyarchaeota archaeon]
MEIQELEVIPVELAAHVLGKKCFGEIDGAASQCNQCPIRAKCLSESAQRAFNVIDVLMSATRLV